MRAGSVSDGLAAVRTMESMGVNVVLADRAGHIAWRPALKVPRRPWARSLPPYLPLPGDGSAEWSGFLDARELPESIDPPAGFIVSANNDMTGHWRGAGQYLQSIVDDGSRAQRAHDLLSAGAGHHSPETLLAMQADTQQWNATAMAPVLLHIAVAHQAELTPAARAIVDALSRWKLSCPSGLAGDTPDAPSSSDAALQVESAGCAAWHAALWQLSEKTLRDELDAWGVTTLFAHTPALKALFLLLVHPDEARSGQTLWDDLRTPAIEGRDQIVLAALDAAGRFLMTALGASPSAWRWGRLYTLTLKSFVADPALVVGPYARAGGISSIDIGIFDYGSDAFAQRQGAAMRFVADISASGIVARFQLPGGLEYHPDSRFFANLLGAYLHNQAFSAAFTLSDVEAATIHKWSLVF
jgi:penicillin amidase